MRLLAACAILALSLGLAGCPPDTTFPGATTEECVGNTPPHIDNLEINSMLPAVLPDEEPFGMALCLHVDWFDPGEDEAGNQGSDAPNMLGGILSVEVSGYDAKNSWIEEGASPEGITLGAPSGELEYSRCLEGSKPDEHIFYTIRVRDRCGAQSNEYSGDYYLGGGPGEAHLVENPEAGDDGCLFPAGVVCVGPEDGA